MLSNFISNKLVFSIYMSIKCLFDDGFRYRNSGELSSIYRDGTDWTDVAKLKTKTRNVIRNS